MTYTLRYNGDKYRISNYYAEWIENFYKTERASTPTLFTFKHDGSRDEVFLITIGGGVPLTLSMIPDTPSDDEQDDFDED